MTNIEVRDAEAKLEHLVAAAAAGEEIVLAKDGVPVARLIPMPKAMYRFGLLKGRLWIADDFDAEIKPQEFCGSRRHVAGGCPRPYPRRLQPG